MSGSAVNDRWELSQREAKARGEYDAPWRKDKIELLESLATSCQKKQIRSMSRERQIDQLFLLETLSCCLADLMGRVLD